MKKIFRLDDDPDTMFDTFIKNLKEQLNEPLPGVEAQVKMAPRLEDLKSRFSPTVRQVKRGSVLLLLYPHKDGILFPLMQRPNYDGVHSGQISLPGGKKEEGDESLIATALRECREEIGVAESKMTVIGTLTELFIPASNFTVLPVVAYTLEKPQFLPDPYEVVSIIESNVVTLLEETSVKFTNRRLFNNMEMEVPYYDVQGHVVWGATAMMLSEFLQIVKKVKQVNNKV